MVAGVEHIYVVMEYKVGKHVARVGKDGAKHGLPLVDKLDVCISATFISNLGF